MSAKPAESPQRTSGRSGDAESVPPPPSPISAITSEIAMHLGRANSLLNSVSPTKTPGRVATPRVSRAGRGEDKRSLTGVGSRLDFSEKFSESMLGAVPGVEKRQDSSTLDNNSSAEIARLAQIIEQLSNTVEAQQKENRILRENIDNKANPGRADATAKKSTPAQSSTEASAARGMGSRRGSFFGRRETLAGVRELLSMEKKNLCMLMTFGVILFAVLAKLMLSYEEDPLY